MNLVTLEETKRPIQEATFPIKEGLIPEMFTIMYANKGIGLAAPQVGYYQTLFVGDLGKGKFTCVNPKLYVLRPDWVMMEEGCLTVPGVRRWIKRHRSVRLRGFDEKGIPFDWFCKGRLAQLVQHEMDHLHGKCIVDLE